MLKDHLVVALRALRHLAVRLRTNEAGAVIDHLEWTWAQFFPTYPFEVAFLDDAFARQYEAEQRLNKTFGTFAALAVLVTCLGLFGLAAFTAQQRTKEIGVRKVLGANVANLVVLLSRDFVLLVLAALALAVPIAYLLMQRWLDAFAYRVELGPGIFALAGGLLVLIAVATVGVHAFRAATADPIRSLRYE